MKPSFKRKAKKLGFAFASILIFLAILEGLAILINLPARPLSEYSTMVSDGYLVDDPQLFWRMKPNISVTEMGKAVTTNSLGLRDDEIVIPKPGNTVRVICLGESTTFGSSIAQNETYSQVAERLLNRSDTEKRWDIINAGVSASTSFQALQWLKRHGRELQPDIVAIYYFGNDFMPSFRRAGFLRTQGFDYTDKELYELRNRYRGFYYLAEKSMLYKTIRSLIVGSMASNMKFRLTRYVDKDSEVDGEWKVRVPDHDRDVVLQGFKDWCAENGVKFLMMHPCYLTSTERKITQNHRWAGNQNVPFLDCVKLFHDSGIPWEDLFWVDIDKHPSPVAHELIGKKLAELFPEI